MIDETDRQLQAEYDRIRNASLSAFRAAKSQETMLKERLAAGKQQMLDVQGRSVRYSILKREVDTNRELYNGLLQRLKEIGINVDVSVADWPTVSKVGYTPTGWNFWSHGFGIEPYEGPASVMAPWINGLSLGGASSLPTMHRPSTVDRGL